jgi:heme-degrading monooxygenase HmoA
VNSGTQTYRSGQVFPFAVLVDIVEERRNVRQGSGLERRSGMFARVSRFEGSPDGMDDALRHVREQILPQIRGQDGNKGLIALGDRQSGTVLGVTLWESEEAMQASEESADRLREESADASNQTVADVERYEVALFEVSQ